MENNKRERGKLTRKLELRVTEEVYLKLEKKANSQNKKISESVRDDLEVITSVIEL